jgi:hypothetical protein
MFIHLTSALANTVAHRVKKLKNSLESMESTRKMQKLFAFSFSEFIKRFIQIFSQEPLLPLINPDIRKNYTIDLQDVAVDEDPVACNKFEGLRRRYPEYH